MSEVEKSVEIERKFHMTGKIPTGLKIAKRVSINQWYVPSLEGEARYRLTEDDNGSFMSFEKTIKTGEGLSRTEETTKYTIEEMVEQFGESGANLGEPLSKFRSSIMLGNCEVVVDTVFTMMKKDSLDIFDIEVDSMYVEVEFDSEEEANAFFPPVWFGHEVTGQKEHSMSSIYKRLLSEAGY